MKNENQIRQAMKSASANMWDEARWLAFLTQKLDVSEQACQEVFQAMISEEEIVVVDGVYYLIDKRNFSLGVLRVVRPNFGFVGDKEAAIYVNGQHFNNALDKDTVLVRHHQFNDRIEGEIIAIIRRNRQFILGTFVEVRKRLTFEPYENKFPYRFNIKGDKAKGQRIIVQVTKVVDGVIHGQVQSVLGLADEPGVDILSVLQVHDLKTEFSKAALDQADQIEERIEAVDLKGRMDHRNQNVITVDGEDAKDLDDAIYLERKADGYRLYVHIADVSAYVTSKSALDLEAKARTSSIYLVDRVVPMLPTKLSNGVCSLHPHVDRLTLTCMMDIDGKGNIDHYAIYPSIIQSKRRMSYNEINQNDEWGHETEMIHDMLDLAKLLHYKREQAGSIDFDDDEAKFLVDAKGKVLEVMRRTQGEGEAMIEAFMVAANETVAKHCRYLKVPVMYRVHEKPDVKKVRELSHTLRILGYRIKGSLDKLHPKEIQKAMNFFKDKKEGPVVSRLMIRSMSKARYDQNPLGHFGLSLQDYAHFTSPIRRYPDLWLHQCLRQYVFNHDFSRYEEDHEASIEEAIYISNKERDILEAERDVEKMKKAEFMVGKKSQVFEGIVSGFSNYGIFVELENTVEGIVPFDSMADHMLLDKQTQTAHGEFSGVQYRLGDAVTVKVMSVNLKEHEVIFSIKERKGKHEKRRKK